MTVKPLILLACSAALLSACASNKRPERPEREGRDPGRIEHLYNQFVARWDYNEDGVATCDDIRVKRARLFRLLDEDKDDFLSSREYRYAKFEDKSFLFFPMDRVDSNTSASVDVEEFVAVPHSEFLNMDEDGNCEISQNEAITTMRETMAGQGDGGGRGSKGGGGRGGKGGGGGRGGPGGGM